MTQNPNRPIHPARMSLAEIEATWQTDDGTPLPECTYDPELHTGPRLTIESTEERTAREAVAREVCATCPALSLCEQYARRTRPTSGIWAGLPAAALTTYNTDLADMEVA
ncbi:WhiB family transcriptional regulator [Nonomuraea sp. NPDC051191]|uniref:WhiB family transcriptional regulator n=1 Tax=Nonomuraea sp. NPDC051191 TaxID=3364372 RepID=UPI0037BBD18B